MESAEDRQRADHHHFRSTNDLARRPDSVLQLIATHQLVS
jgi:hypothetical protein